MFKYVGVLIILCIFVSACQERNYHGWVVGGSGQLRKADSVDVRLARDTAAKYITAWVNRDYDAMFDLQSTRGIKDRGTFGKLASTWRTRGFPHVSDLTPGSDARIASTLEPVLGVSDEQAQVLLATIAFGQDTVDEVRAKQWPDRVLFMRVEVASDWSVLILTKENGNWTVLNAPGMMGKETLKGHPWSP